MCIRDRGGGVSLDPTTGTSTIDPNFSGGNSGPEDDTNTIVAIAVVIVIVIIAVAVVVVVVVINKNKEKKVTVVPMDDSRGVACSTMAMNSRA